MTPRVSVVVPVRNGAPFVARCIACLKAQTLESVEFLIVDDASTDGTPERLLREIAGDGRFKVIRQAAQAGPLSARMRGVSEASAPVVMFMDFDDEIVPNACSVVAETMSRYRADVFCYAMDAVCADGCDVRALERCRSYLARRSARQGLVHGAEDCFDLFFSNTGITASTCDKAVKTEVLKHVYNMIGDGAGLLCAQDFLQTTLLFLDVETVCVDQGQVLYHYNFGNGMSGHAPGNVSWEQFLRRTTAIDAYPRLCRVLAAMDNLDSVQRKRIEEKFLRSISGTALPEIWKLPADLIPAGMGVIARKWGTWALPTRDPGQPGDAGLSGGWIHRLSGKLKKLPHRLAKILKSAFSPHRRHCTNGGTR